jgi:Probable Zinc-ribbon domain
VTAKTSRRGWWRCSKDPRHESEAPIADRAVKGHGCPMCSGRRATPETSLLALFPDVAAEWHPTKNLHLGPEQVRPQSSKRVWWRCAKDPRRGWQAKVQARRFGIRNCTGCAARALVENRSLAAHYPEIAAEWHPTKNGALGPEQVFPHATLRVFWQCPAHPSHVYAKKIADRIRPGRDKCPACAGRLATPTSSLAARYPEVAYSGRPGHPFRRHPATG